MTTDVCGPFSESFSKKRHLLIFKDTYTKYRFVFFIKQKSEVKECLEEVLMLSLKLQNMLCEIFYIFLSSTIAVFVWISAIFLICFFLFNQLNNFKLFYKLGSP